MSLEKNKALARRYQEEVWGKGDLALIDELLGADFVDHLAGPFQGRGVGQLRHHGDVTLVLLWDKTGRDDSKSEIRQAEQAEINDQRGDAETY